MYFSHLDAASAISNQRPILSRRVLQETTHSVQLFRPDTSQADSRPTDVSLPALLLSFPNKDGRSERRTR
jgi:hypothetical protein